MKNCNKKKVECLKYTIKNYNKWRKLKKKWKSAK